jgi:hypothetical protein
MAAANSRAEGRARRLRDGSAEPPETTEPASRWIRSGQAYPCAPWGLSSREAVTAAAGAAGATPRSAAARPPAFQPVSPGGQAGGRKRGRGRHELLVRTRRAGTARSMTAAVLVRAPRRVLTSVVGRVACPPCLPAPPLRSRLGAPAARLSNRLSGHGARSRGPRTGQRTSGAEAPPRHRRRGSAHLRLLGLAAIIAGWQPSGSQIDPSIRSARVLKSFSSHPDHQLLATRRARRQLIQIIVWTQRPFTRSLGGWSPHSCTAFMPPRDAVVVAAARARASP